MYETRDTGRMYETGGELLHDMVYPGSETPISFDDLGPWATFEPWIMYPDLYPEMQAPEEQPYLVGGEPYTVPPVEVTAEAPRIPWWLWLALGLAGYKALSS